MPLISLVVPIYNVEEYLRKCVDSLLEQSYPNIEIVLVDDGATDNCPQICDEYGTKDARIRVLHKKNGGLADARNYGAAHAKGDYISFIDSDDYVSKDYAAYLYGILKKYQADIAVCGLTVVWDDFYQRKESSRSECLDTEEALRRMCYFRGFGVSACSKLYSREMILKYPYPVGKLHEDLATTYKIIGSCERIAYGSREIYFYRQRLNSIMHEPLEEKHLYGITAANEMLSYIEAHFPNSVQAAHCRCARKIYEFMPRVMTKGGYRSDAKNFHFLQTELKKHISYVLRDKNTLVLFKIRYIGMMLGYYPMKLIWNGTELLRKCIKRNKHC